MSHPTLLTPCPACGPGPCVRECIAAAEAYEHDIVIVERDHARDRVADLERELAAANFDRRECAEHWKAEIEQSRKLERELAVALVDRDAMTACAHRAQKREQVWQERAYKAEPQVTALRVAIDAAVDLLQGWVDAVDIDATDAHPDQAFSLLRAAQKAAT